MLTITNENISIFLLLGILLLICIIIIIFFTMKDY